MLSDFNSNVSNAGIIVRLRSDFTYSRKGVEITLEEGTSIVVDESMGLGYFESVCFQIEPTDYIIMYLN